MSANSEPGQIRVLTVITTILVACFGVYLFFLSRDEKVVQFHAAVGDSMGVLSAVFNSVAVAFAVWSVWLQRDELKVTRDELEHLQSDAKRTARIHQLNTRVELIRFKHDELAVSSRFANEMSATFGELQRLNLAMQHHPSFVPDSQRAAVFLKMPTLPVELPLALRGSAQNYRESLENLSSSVVRKGGNPQEEVYERMTEVLKWQSAFSELLRERIQDLDDKQSTVDFELMKLAQEDV